jgi:hypothetical protein
MAASPECLEAIRARDEALAERDEARAAFERLLSDLEELLRRHGAISRISPTADQSPPPDPPPPTAEAPPVGRVFGKARK